MIPKILHFCWFGKGKYPDNVKLCMKSWEMLKDYKIMFWNEDTFDVNSTLFTKEAYENGKYAFVSDYVRVYALYKFGGVYLDTDIEVLKDFSSVLNDAKIVLGTDEGGNLTAFMASEKEHLFWGKLLQFYNGMCFIKPDGTFETTVNNKWMEEELKSSGYIYQNTYQKVGDGIIIYPDDYFHAKSLIDGKLHITQNTFCIHHHTLTWVTWKTKVIRWFRMNLLVPILGKKDYKIFTDKLRGNKES